MIPSLLKIWPLYMCCGLLTGCVSASNWLSGLAQYQRSHLDASHHLAPIRIGVTTKQETQERFGNPTDQQVHIIDGKDVEAWSYTTTEAMIKPYQYLPFLGGIAFLEPMADPTPSSAISFSSDDQISGLTISTVNAYGDIRSPEIFSIEDSPTSFYGMRNPDVFHAPANSTGSRP